MIALKQAIQLIVKHLCCLCLGNVFYMCITITDSANIKALDEFYYINCKCIHVYLHSLCIHIITVYIELNVLWYITCIHNLLWWLQAWELETISAWIMYHILLYFRIVYTCFYCVCKHECKLKLIYVTITCIKFQYCTVSIK